MTKEQIVMKTATWLCNADRVKGTAQDEAVITIDDVIEAAWVTETISYQDYYRLRVYMCQLMN